MMIPKRGGPQPTRLTTGELAERLRLHPRTLERWRREGVGPRFMKSGGRIRYRDEDVETYEVANLSGKEPAA
jgi:excisionase family DNA binding protein